MRCRASAPRSKVIRPWRVIWAAVWLAAEWVTPTAPARSRMDSGPTHDQRADHRAVPRPVVGDAEVGVDPGHVAVEQFEHVPHQGAQSPGADWPADVSTR